MQHKTTNGTQLLLHGPEKQSGLMMNEIRVLDKVEKRQGIAEHRDDEHGGCQ